jgi:plastocyanin
MAGWVPMRAPALVLTALLVVAATACSPQDPEVSVNDQVPAAQAVAEVEGGSEGEGGGGTASFEEAEVVFTADGLAFTEAPDQIPADTPVVVGLEIGGGQPHNVVFEGFQGDSPIVEGEGDGQFAGTASIPAGEYTYYCSVPGHRGAGMEGEVTVA